MQKMDFRYSVRSLFVQGACLLFLAGCVFNPAKDPLDPRAAVYGESWSIDQHLDVLISAGHLSEAATTWANNRKEVLTAISAGRQIDGLNALAEFVNARSAAGIGQCLSELQSWRPASKPPDLGRWSTQKSRLKACKYVHSEYLAKPVVDFDAFRLPESSQLETTIKEVETLYISSLPSAIVSYLSSDVAWDFFGNFPVDPPLSALAAATTAEELIELTRRGDFDASKQVRFAKELMTQTRLRGSSKIRDGSAESVKQLAQLICYGPPLPERDSTPADLLKLAAAPSKECKTAGIDPPHQSTSACSLYATVDSSVLYKDWVKRDPTVLNQDSLAEAMSDGCLIGIVFESVEFDARTIDQTEVTSRYKAGSRQVANPRYRQAEAAVAEALSRYNYAVANYNRTSAQAAGNPYMGVAVGIASGAMIAAGNELQRARATLANLYPSKTETVYQKYKVAVSEVEVSKTAIFRVIVNSQGEGPWETSVELTNTSTFRVAFDKHPSDRDLPSNVFSRERLDSKIEARFPATIEQIAQLAAQADWSRIDRRYMVKRLQVEGPTAATRVGATGASNRTSPIPTLPAADSIVVIDSPDGSGAGFYIAPNLILTNQHVIGRSKQVPIRNIWSSNFDGETICVDFDRDLALVRVADEGKPLKLRAAGKVPVGSSVSALGHPQGLEYSLTTGTLSALRVFTPRSAVSADGFRFIQTDAPISPGNSGGPLLYDGRVIGVNTFKLADLTTEGLGLAIASEEVIDFIGSSRCGGVRLPD